MKVLVCLLTLNIACGSDPSGPDSPQGNFDRLSLLANVGENIISPAYDQFVGQAMALETTITAYCAALGQAEEATALEDARDAWDAMMSTAQYLEVMQFGPVGMDDASLRNVIYSWPISSSCAADLDANEQRTDPTYDIAQRTVNRRGLDVHEYLLFSESLEHTCPSNLEPQGWAALPDSEKKQARCNYAQLVAQDLTMQVAELEAQWTAYAASFADGSAFSSAQMGVNEVSNGLFYLDTETKDAKVAAPAGITTNSCAMNVCPEDLESLWAHRSKENIAENLRGFSAVFHGTSLDGLNDGPGFYEFLVGYGAADLADNMSTKITAATAAVENIPGTLQEALNANPSSVTQAHTAIREVTNLLKSEFLTVLALEAPNGAAGDND